MSQPSVPISFPIKTLEDLKSRAYFNSFHFPFNKASVPLSPSPTSLPDRRRLLVCHDMAGGYTDDKWVQGGTNPDAYDITHWYLMDVFVYFAHSLVTLPPPGWTNTAHSHGVKVLGTFICEWDEGQKIANEMLSTMDSARMYAKRLTELAAVLGFDGWLLNMEVSLERSKIPILKEFVSHLTQTMHAEVPGSLVIWYDSITIDGQLIWQNRLNEKNKPFFDLCDGIFVNYTWASHFPEMSAGEAGDRKYDVYMGIDAFGRGTFGGGQWNTNVALDLLKKTDISAALFAPGWVYETNQPPDRQTSKAMWWGLVDGAWGVSRKCIQSLPFYSNFDQGNGYHFSISGKEISDAPWNNLSCQGVQPFMKFAPDNPMQVYIDNKESSYSGGSSIIFKGMIDPSLGDSLMIKLFSGDVLMGDTPIQFSYSVKLEDDALLDIYSVYSDPISKEITTVLLSSDSPDRLLGDEYGTLLKAQHIQTTQASPGTWVLREYEVPTMRNRKMTEIGAWVHRSSSNAKGPPKSYRAALGHCLAATPGDLGFPPATSWAVRGESVEWTGQSAAEGTVSVKIEWKLLQAGGRVPWFPSYNVYGRGDSRAGLKFLGVAQVGLFYVDRFEAPLGKASFVIQPCAANGSVQDIGVSPSLELVK